MFNSRLTVFDLHVLQDGDRNLIWENVKQAIDGMVEWYDNQPDDTLPLSEVHVLYNYFYEGSVTMRERGLECKRVEVKGAA